MGNTFIYGGRKFINGYACDSAGRPITMKNGYSSEDENDAQKDCEEAWKAMNENTVFVPKKPKKYAKKIRLELPLDYPLEKEDLELLERSHKSENGLLLNDAGEEISVENGYTDADERYGRFIAKDL